MASLPEEIKLDEVTQRGAARRLRKPSLFDRPCARVIAALREEAGTLPDIEAPRVYRRFANSCPETPSSLRSRSEPRKAGDWDAFDKVVEKLDAEATLTDAQLGNLLLFKENRLGNLASALKHATISTGHWLSIPGTLHRGCAG